MHAWCSEGTQAYACMHVHTPLQAQTCADRTQALSESTAPRLTGMHHVRLQAAMPLCEASTQNLHQAHEYAPDPAHLDDRAARMHGSCVHGAIGMEGVEQHTIARLRLSRHMAHGTFTHGG